eukprot:1159760-Pelagomonas_calceolata.AAC.2
MACPPKAVACMHAFYYQRISAIMLCPPTFLCPAPAASGHADPAAAAAAAAAVPAAEDTAGAADDTPQEDVSS